jgi:gas vesicle protein
MNNYQNAQSSMSSNLLYLLVGGGIGATLALLFAPKPGVELRQDASDAVKQGLETANKTVSQLKDTAGDYYQKAQDKASEIYQVAFKAASDGTQEAKRITNQSFDSVQQKLNKMAPDNSEMPPDSVKRPFDRTDIKTGIL